MTTKWIDLVAYENMDAKVYRKVDVEKAYQHHDGCIETHHLDSHKLTSIKTQLSPHQLYDIEAMLQLENRRGIKYNKQILYTQTGMLSEPFGSGKTFIILGLIRYLAVPTQYQDIRFIKTISHVSKFKSTQQKDIYCYGDACKDLFITVKRSYKNIIKTNLVFCGAPVAMQWENAIIEFTDLKYIIVSGINGLKNLYNIIINGKINDYDIVIIKNGFISGKFEYDGYVEPRNVKRTNNTRYIYNIIANFSRNLGVTWGRVFIDDFDVIDLPKNCALMPCLFTWVVSSTQRENNTITDNIIAEFYTGYDYGMDCTKILNYKDYEFSINSMVNPIIKSIFNVSCSGTFTDKCVNTGIPKFWLYKFANPNDTLIDCIRNLDNNEIVEMLNGDAIETAADKIGIKSTSVADIFSKILDTNYTDYMKYINMQQAINKITLENLKSPPEGEPYIYTLDDALMARQPTYEIDNLYSIIQNAKQICKDRKEKAGVAIERVKSNLKEGYCQICCNEFEDENIIINKCCGIILCSVCGIQCSNFSNDTMSLVGRCANCRQELPIKNCIFINKDFDCNKILVDDDKYVVKDKVGECLTFTKIDLIIDICTGKSTYPRQQVKPVVKNLLMGCTELKESKKRSVIIFAAYDETINNIKLKLTEKNISYSVLVYTAEKNAKIVKDFTDGNTNVLLLKFSKNCAGLNLQTATDMIICHKLNDQSVESQGIGRIQRFGRTSTANIHYLLYDNEIKNFSFTVV